MNNPIIYPIGTRVVSKKPIRGLGSRDLHPAGAVGSVSKSPTDGSHKYRVRFPDGFEAVIAHDQLTLLSEYKADELSDTTGADDLFGRVIYRCVIGSQAYGLSTDQSDVDRRGIYLPPADLHWSLYGVPEQIENDQNEEAYWELQKFIVLALKANPNLLECLYSPIVETKTALAEELLDAKEMFLSRLAYQTYNGYVMSQFKKMQADLRNHGSVKWKHVMHLIRLLHSGIHLLTEGFVQVDVGPMREQFLSIRRGEMAWEDVESWREQLHREFSDAYASTKLPERPDYEKANAFLIRARRLAMGNELP